MALSAVAIAALALGGVSASEYKPHKHHRKAVEPAPPALDQLETARLTQAAQRAEFGVEGDASAFKFSFSDPVRLNVARHGLRFDVDASAYHAYARFAIDNANQRLRLLVVLPRASCCQSLMATSAV